MSTKTLVLHVRHLNEFSNSEISTFLAQLNQNTIKRIKLLAEMARQLGVDWMEEYSNEGDWSDVSYGDAIAEGACQVDVIAQLVAQAKSVESQRLRVSPMEFYFTAIPKHYDIVNQMSCASVPLSVLDDDQDLFINGFND
ncbi:hypothetical protein E4188_22395 (plasmid) [Aeromonas media]|uniref:Uncharacterized protein n=1 Tax=Aeromonas media TaxID=651 RepID=A0ABX6NXZ2_AERME|nr:hypothetical protein [Aeromonas media]QJT36983.1 hypothetical protein E4187_22070 [Aeromonas media]QJT41252.1 hypothetical protein E4188_22395 [Aeromonas media]